MSQIVTPAEAKTIVHAGAEIAFLDVREHGQYGEGHPLGHSLTLRASNVCFGQERKLRPRSSNVRSAARTSGYSRELECSCPATQLSTLGGGLVA
jgi:hypothetical protein